MVVEQDFKKVKKGQIFAVTDIPVSYDNTVVISFSPITINKIVLIVELTAGASMTVTIDGVHGFPVAGDQSYEVYSKVFVADEIVEIIGVNFLKYDFAIQTDASTTGRIYAFYEYNYDLIK